MGTTVALSLESYQNKNVNQPLQRHAIIGENRAVKPAKMLSTSSSLPVLFENDRVLAIDKPAGISHHDSGVNDGGDAEPTQNRYGILSHLRQLQSMGQLDYTGRLYGVHRLDQVTSGILLLAKDATTASQLTRAFRQGQVTKYYVGLSQRSPPSKKQGWIRGHMVRGRRKTWLLTPTTTSNSSSSFSNSRTDSNNVVSAKQHTTLPNMAVTRFFTAGLGNLPPPITTTTFDDDSTMTSLVAPRTCILFRPYTGRTHQLRVAAKAMGLALLGDPLYRDGSALPRMGDSSTDVSHLALFPGTRTCLHAAALHVTLEDVENPITIWSPPPFGKLFWKNDTSGIEAAFDQVILRLMDKHCDCPALRAKLLLGHR